METWKKIPEFPDYEVSDMGRVRSTDRIVAGSVAGMRKIKGKILKPRVNPQDGRMQITLHRGVTRRVHNLVATAFLGPKNGRAVHHINGNGTDNRLCNLRYMDSGEHIREHFGKGHDTRNHPKGSANANAILTEDAVRRIKAGEFEGMTQRAIGEMFGVSNFAISDIKRGRRWRHIGG